MTQTFKVGEVAILCHLTRRSYLNDVEVTITSPLEEQSCVASGEICLAYLTDLPNNCNGYFFVEPKYLRKKPPKQSTDEWAAEQVAKVTKPIVQPEGVPA
jgi:hypothetical protein